MTITSQMGSAFRKTLLALAQPSLLLDAVPRRSLRILSRIVRVPLGVQVELAATSRPPYAYCMYHAATLAKRLGLSSVSAIEFGVAGGNGLLFLEEMAGRVERELGVKVEVYGFDSGKGLPAPREAADLPYWFQDGQYEMDQERLRIRLSRSTLVLGDVAQTVATFFSEFKPAPVGTILNDLDLYSSTCDSLKIFDSPAGYFLPRVFLYFDDTVGTEVEMYSEAVGQLRAVSEFNASHRDVHIGLNRNLLARWRPPPYAWQVYYAHLKRHPLYSRYVGREDQKAMEELLRLVN